MKKPFTTIILGCMIFQATAQVIHVPGDQPSIQAGINAAADGDTVLVADSTYYENFIFKGKAITLASHFLVDGDTSHISKTIIDGSQPSHPDTASVVCMISGEDTTSVLCGFTITGGNGLYFENGGYRYLGGGGVIMLYSGGKIERNIFRDNHMTDREGIDYAGAAVAGIVYNNHTAIIRENMVINNSFEGHSEGAGGISVYGGRLIIEGNTISDNISNSYLDPGGALDWYCDPDEVQDFIPELIIRNNVISGNHLFIGDITYYPNRGGMQIMTMHVPVDIKVYNNLIYNNYVHNEKGGGMLVGATEQAVILNNTIVNNKADRGGKQLMLGSWAGLNSTAILFDNILWSDEDDGISEIVGADQPNVLMASTTP